MNAKLSLAILAAAALSAFLPGQAPPEWVLAAPGKDRWPGLEAIHLRHEAAVRILPDGRVAERVLLATKVFLPIPFNRSGLGDPRIAFDAGAEELKILQARTWTPAGRLLETPGNGLNEVLPDAVAAAPDFCRFRELVVTFLGIQEGCVTILEYERTQRRPGSWPLEGRVEAQQPFPILAQELSLEVPAGVAVEWELLAPEERRPGPRVERREGAGTTYRFLRGGPVPPAGRQADALVFGTRKRTDLAVELDRRLAAAGPLPEALELRLAGRLAHPAGPWERVRILAEEIGNGLAPVEWPLGRLGWECRPAARVWESAYASPLEWAAVLALGLRQAGFTEVAAVPFAFRPRPGVGCLALAEEIWLAAKAPTGERIWVQAGGAPGKPEPSHLVGAAALAGPEPDLPGEGTVTLAGHLETAAGGALTGSLSWSAGGTALPAAQAALAGLEPILAPFAAEFAAARLEALRVHRLEEGRAEAAFQLAGGRLPQDRAGFFRLVLPLPPGSPAMVIPDLHRPATTELTRVPGGARREKVELLLTWPEGWRAAALPSPLERSGPLGRVRLSLQEPAGGRSLQITYELELRTGSVGPGEWEELGRLLLPLLAPGARTVLLEPGAGR